MYKSIYTWNTVSKATGNRLKLAGGVFSSKFHSPPNNCMPNRANININKKSKNNRDMIERILFNNDMTKFLNESQYRVTLNIRSNLSERITDIPNDSSGFIYVKITSNMLPTMTMQSNLLNVELKYCLEPRPYILIVISSKNVIRKTNSV